jgi:hypothetical protein
MTNKQGGELAPIVSDLKQIVQLIEMRKRTDGDYFNLRFVR